MHRALSSTSPVATVEMVLSAVSAAAIAKLVYLMLVRVDDSKAKEAFTAASGNRGA